MVAKKKPETAPQARVMVVSTNKDGLSEALRILARKVLEEKERRKKCGRQSTSE